MALIQTEKLEKTFRGEAFEVHAVANITLNIEQGEFSAIVGPSGSGKTTLLNLLGGLDHPSSGRILIDGKDIGLMKEKELIDFRLHNIGFVFQSYNLIDRKSTRLNSSHANISYAVFCLKKKK